MAMAMNNSQHYTPSELIYLFLDGESDGVQQSTLFAALAHDAELQSEFQEAVLVGRTLDRVRNDVHPPQDFTEQVFTAAGFTPPLFQPAPIPVAGKWSASLHTIIRRVGIPVASAFIGALTMFLLMNTGRNNDIVTPVRPVAESTNIQHTHTNSSNPVVSTPTHRADDGAANTFVSAGSRQADKRSSAKSSRIASGIHSSARDRASASVASDGGAGTQSTADNPVVTLSLPDPEPQQLVVDAPVPLVDQVTPQTPAQQLDPPAAYADMQPIYRWDRGGNAGSPGVSMFVRGIESISSFPDRKNNIEASGSTSNVGFGCLYHYSRNQAVGMEVTRELLPIHSLGEGDAELNSVLLWIGGLWQIQTDFPGLRSDIQPFLRLGLGGTAYGPSGKALLGIMYTAEQRLSISLGVETTALVAWRNGVVGSTEKIAFSYGLSFHF